MEPCYGLCLLQGRQHTLTFDDAISLLKCANQFLFENLKSSMDAFIAESLDTGSCFRILVGSDRFGVQSTKKKAMVVIASNCQDASCSNALAVPNIEMMRECVSNDSLVIKSELDVLHFIFRWLVKHGHIMDECLQASYENNQSDEDGSTANSSQSFTTEDIRTLTSNLRIKHLNLADLKGGNRTIPLSTPGRFEKLVSR